MPTPNQAFSGVKIDALLKSQGWDKLNLDSLRFEVVLPDGPSADYALCARHGRAIAVIEAMKMENELRAGRDGIVVELPVTGGQSVEAGTLIAVVAANPSE